MATQGRLALVKVSFLSKQYSGHPGSKNISVEEPAGTITCKDHHAFISAYYGNGKPTSIIQVTSEDSPMTIKIKEFMALYGIIDIKMRMLKIDELKLIMGFPEDYVLVGSQADQKKFIGNAVEVNMARVLCEAICKEIIRKRKVA